MKKYLTADFVMFMMTYIKFNLNWKKITKEYDRFLVWKDSEAGLLAIKEIISQRI